MALALFVFYFIGSIQHEFLVYIGKHAGFNQSFSGLETYCHHWYMWCDVMRCYVMWCDAMRCDVIWYDMIWYMTSHDMTRHDMTWYDMIVEFKFYVNIPMCLISTLAFENFSQNDPNYFQYISEKQRLVIIKIDLETKSFPNEKQRISSQSLWALICV